MSSSPETGYADLMVTFARFEGDTARGTQTLLDRGRIRHCQAGEVRLGSAGASHVLADVQVMGHLPHPAPARVREGATVLEWDTAAFGRLVGRFRGGTCARSCREVMASLRPTS